MRKSIFLVLAIMTVCTGCAKTVTTSQPTTVAAKAEAVTEIKAEETTIEETTPVETTEEVIEEQVEEKEEEMTNEYKSIVLEDNNNYKLIWLPTSAEADAMREDIRSHRDTYTLEEDYFPQMVKELLSRELDQKAPEVETKNKLNTLEYGENKVLTLEKEDSSDYDAILFYIHGGMYAYEIDKIHINLCDKLADELNAKVYMPLYPLAPEATYKEAFEFLDEVYPDLVAQNKPIYIMGDSAGGGLSIAYTEYLKEKGEHLPDKIVGLSPWVDVSNINSIMEDYAKEDLELAIYAPTQMGKVWAGDTDTKNYMVSPMYGNLEGMPDTMIITGTGEIMLPDSIQFFKKLKNLGQKVTLVLGEDLWHVFPCTDIPQADEARRLIKEFVNE